MADRGQDRSRNGYGFEPLSYAVFGACIAVQRQMGVHCVEVDYQRALAVELKARGLEYGGSDAMSDQDRSAVSRQYPALPIPSAHAVVVRDGRALLVRRAGEPGKGRWSVPGGMVELGETVAQAACRELCEECGVKIQIDRVLDVADTIVRDDHGRIRFHYVVIYLLARWVAGEPRAASDATEVRWVRSEELEGLDMHPAARQAVRRALAAV